MECYEDMFKEITRKLYGEDDIDTMMSDYENLSSSVTPMETLSEQEDNDVWVSSDEVIPWTDSKIASYNATQKMFRCNECECLGFLSRIAEHWLGTHANLRVFQCPQCPYASAWARCVRMHLARQHNVTPESIDPAACWKENPVLEEVTNFLQRLKTKVEGDAPPMVEVKQEEIEEDERTETVTIADQPTETISVVIKMEEPPETTVNSPESEPTEEVNDIMNTSKRYNCTYCPYATDRRDLYTRHENIHREEKPFHCYICMKQFTRADHVKKHFVRMHREVPYDINKIKQEKAKDSLQTFFEAQPKVVEPPPKPEITIPSLQTTTAAAAAIATTPKQEKLPKKKPGEKRYTCCYCSWSGVDNWCLKRHLNTHLKPYSCSLCEYKAARTERLATHVYKVHNKRFCTKCSFMADDQAALNTHQQQQHQLGKAVVEQQKVPQPALTDDVVGQTQTYEWITLLKSEPTSAEDDETSVPPSITISEDNVVIVCEAINLTPE
ncbi:ZnF_C2H2 [Nesidiocoris tenuis]|nr:ZnF_C2H2 [Nesidiocoris tenuis]